MVRSRKSEKARESENYTSGSRVQNDQFAATNESPRESLQLIFVKLNRVVYSSLNAFVFVWYTSFHN